MSSTAVMPDLTTKSATAPIAAELVGVTHRYGKHTALRDISLRLRKGEVVALLGPNGAGKTTAVKLLLGLLKPAEGAVKVFGGNPSERGTRQRVGVMLQVARVPETLTVREYVDLFSSYYPNPLPMVEVIEAAGLAGIEKRQFGDLSGGQKQRLLFGLALCGNPDLVFLDEPTLGMDIETRHNLWRQVRALADAGKTVLLTTHYLEEADTLADRVLVIAEGVIVAEGTPLEIKSHATGRTVTCVTKLTDEFLRELPGVLCVERNGTAVTMTVGGAEDVLRTLLAMDASLHSLEVSSPTLEDAFLALTRKEEV
jgi:ABC-2 type transport system ATP-binding protein